MWKYSFDEIYDDLSSIAQINGHTLNYAKSKLFLAKEFCQEKIRRGGHTQNEYMAMKALVSEYQEKIENYERKNGC